MHCSLSLSIISSLQVLRRQQPTRKPKHTWSMCKRIDLQPSWAQCKVACYTALPGRTWTIAMEQSPCNQNPHYTIVYCTYCLIQLPVYKIFKAYAHYNTASVHSYTLHVRIQSMRNVMCNYCVFLEAGNGSLRL